MNLLTYSIIIMSIGILQPPSADNKTYSVKKTEQEVIVTGNGDSPLWKNATGLTDFIYPWDKETPPATSFRALHSKDWLYLLYDIKDENIILYVEKNDKTDVLNSDRAEIFFKQDEDMTLPYYGLEMDPLGRVFDYEGHYPKGSSSAWSWPAGQLVLKGSRTKDGYKVEVAISKASLRQLGVLKDKTMMAGLYRGNCIKLVGNEATFKWISWVRPKSVKPNFHIPSSFGVLLLAD